MAAAIVVRSVLPSFACYSAIERFGGVFSLQALQWAEVEGGPKSPLLCDLWYFVNRFTFIKVLRLSAIVGNS